MGQYTAIAEVSQSIIKLLRKELFPDIIKKYEQIALSSPSNSGDVKVGLHLYEIKENSDFIQRNMISAGENILKFPPQSLTLFYLLTVYSNADKNSKAIDEQRILGKVMQILNDHPVFEKDDLLGSIGDEDESFEIIRENLSFEDKVKLWQFPNIPYQLSMVYKVQPVMIESTRIKEVKRVKDVSINIRR